MINDPQNPKSVRDYTEDELCETVFYLSRYAECLEIDKAITVPDERELLWMILEWARQFEQNYDIQKDHQMELETQGPRWLRATFPYTPELDDQEMDSVPTHAAEVDSPTM